MVLQSLTPLPILILRQVADVAQTPSQLHLVKIGSVLIELK